MPVRATAKPPGEFIRDHLVAAGGMDYPQSIHRAYKQYLRTQGIRNGASRASVSKYIWLANKLGLILFDHAEPVSYWDGVVDGVDVAAGYVREPRPLAPSPRHYYRIVDDGDPRWIRLEASYRESIGLEVPRMAPRAPVRPPAPPPERPPKKARVQRVRKPRPAKLPRVPKPKPPTPAERVQPFEDRIGTLIGRLYELETTPSMETVVDIENELLELGEEIVTALATAKGAERTLLSNINSRLRRALEEMGLIRSSVSRVRAAETEAERGRAMPPLHAAIRVVVEDLSARDEG